MTNMNEKVFIMRQCLLDFDDFTNIKNYFEHLENLSKNGNMMAQQLLNRFNTVYELFDGIAKERPMKVDI
jgi:hypothetical protein